MKLDIAGISREIVAEREKVAYANRRGPSVGASARKEVTTKESLAIQDAHKRCDPEGTARLLVRLAIRLLDGENLSHDARAYLHDALIFTASNPSKAAVAFGLIRPSHRTPVSTSRIYQALQLVHELRAKGVRPLTTAFERVHERTGLSKSLIAREWKSYRRVERKKIKT